MAKPTQNASSRRSPLACFDSLQHIESNAALQWLTSAQRNDFETAHRFLLSYTGSEGTFTSYRDVERLLHWTWHIAESLLEDLKREDIEQFLRFCQKPPSAWLGTHKTPRFKEVNGQRTPNPQWKPFVATIAKSAVNKGPLSRQGGLQCIQRCNETAHRHHR